MPVFTKLIIFVVLNIAGLSGLVLRLLKANVSPLGALMLAWRIVVNGHRNHELRGSVYPDGASILHKTWWLMSGLIILFWIIEPGKAYGYLMGLLLGLHLLWYLLSQVNAHFGEDRIFELNPQWGMVYLAVRPDSVLNARSLSELDLRKKNLLVLAIERKRQIIPFPKGLETLMPGDHLVMFGDLNYYRGLES